MNPLGSMPGWWRETTGPSEWEIVALGAFAGLTIFLGLPVAAARGLSDRTRAILSALAVGVLLYLFVDVLNAAHQIVVAPLAAGGGSLTSLGYAAILASAFVAGAAMLLLIEGQFARRIRPKDAPGPPAGGELSATFTPLHLSTMIAVGIGMHNLSEGLAIGAAYSAGLPLAVVLVIGFAIHNTTEGFGILAPGMIAGTRYSIRRLLALGLIGGGPTFVGTILGSLVHVSLLPLVFSGLAAGAILYVVLQMSRPMLAPASRSAAICGVLVGFVIGFLTDVVVTIGGA
ncbi:MAG: zinc permease [Thermoplasmata archaeon]|nr:zinc permease [Thermoplasmata archaeon]